MDDMTGRASDTLEAVIAKLRDHADAHRKFAENHGKQWAAKLANDLDAAIAALAATPQAPPIPQIVAEMVNFADVADRCTITQVANAPAAIRCWAERLAGIAPRSDSGWPPCPECGAGALFACVACSATNYPPEQARPVEGVAEKLIEAEFYDWYASQDCRGDWPGMVRAAYFARHPAPAPAPEVVARLVEAASRLLPVNVCVDNPNVPDSTEVPLLATLAELRAVKQALAPFTAAQQDEDHGA